MELKINFQAVKRVLCCLMAFVFLCFCVVRPVTAHAAAIATTATICLVEPAVLIPAILIALGFAIVNNNEFQTMCDEMTAAVSDYVVVHDDTAFLEVLSCNKRYYLDTDVVARIQSYLFEGTATTHPIITTQYDLSSSADVIVSEGLAQLDVTYAGEREKCEAYSNCYVTDVTLSSGEVRHVITFTDGTCEFTVKENGLFYINTASAHKTIIYSDSYFELFTCTAGDDSPYFVADSVASAECSERLYLIEKGLIATGSIAATLDDEIYADLTAQGLVIDGTSALCIPVDVSDDSVQETDDAQPVTLPYVETDLTGILGLLRSILAVLKSIYSAVSGTVVGAIQSVGTLIQTQFEWIWEHLNTAFETLGATFTTVVEWMWDQVSTAFIWLGGYITDAIETVGTTVSTILDVIRDVRAFLFKTLLGILNKTFDIVTLIPITIQTWFEWIWEHLNTAFETLSTTFNTTIGTWAQTIIDTLVEIFVPSEDYITAKVEALRARFDWINPILDYGDFLLGELFSTEPPVIYCPVSAAETRYNYGADVIFLDMRWYARYKPTGDAIISGFLWLLFGWRMFLKLPSIINGVGGTVGHINDWDYK